MQAHWRWHRRGRRPPRRACKPDALIDWPISALDYELVDIFNWQEEAQNMYSQQELVRHLSVQKTQTIEEYIRKEKIQPDLVVKLSSCREFHFFKRDRVDEYSNKFGWTVITDSNKHELFMKMVREMRMDHSYKPVFIKAILKHADAKGRVNLSSIVTYFHDFYESRRAAGLVVEKANSIYAKDTYTDKESETTILSNPFKRFEDMQMVRHTKTLGIVEVDGAVWKNLAQEEKAEIERICDQKLAEYYGRW